MAYPYVVKKNGPVETLLSSGDTTRELPKFESAKASKLIRTNGKTTFCDLNPSEPSFFISQEAFRK